MTHSDSMLTSIRSLLKQIGYVFDDKQFDMLKNKKITFDNIVIAGIGSSLSGYKIVASLYEDQFLIPIFVVNNRSLPGWAGKNTLVIFSSYSGNSDEIMHCAKAAVKKKCQIIAITCGGQLLSLLKSKAHFIYLINPGTLNPCGQPRMGIGFSLAATLMILYMLKVMAISSGAMESLRKDLRFIDLAKIERLAKKYAYDIANTHTQIISGGFLWGIADLFAKELHWNAKQFASMTLTPEAMHHTLEGIMFPAQKNRTLFVSMRSNLMNTYDTSALNIAKKYISKMNHTMLEIKISASSKFATVCTGMLLSAYISYFIAKLQNVNPTPTPSIEYYKKGDKK